MNAGFFLRVALNSLKFHGLLKRLSFLVSAASGFPLIFLGEYYYLSGKKYSGKLKSFEEMIKNQLKWKPLSKKKNFFRTSPSLVLEFTNQIRNPGILVEGTRLYFSCESLNFVHFLNFPASINLFLPLGRPNHFHFVQHFVSGQYTFAHQDVYHGFQLIGIGQGKVFNGCGVAFFCHFHFS